MNKNEKILTFRGQKYLDPWVCHVTEVSKIVLELLVLIEEEEQVVEALALKDLKAYILTCQMEPKEP